MTEKQIKGKKPSFNYFQDKISLRKRILYPIRNPGKRRIDSSLFERVMLTDKKLPAVLREIHPKTNYSFRDSWMSFSIRGEQSKINQ